MKQRLSRLLIIGAAGFILAACRDKPTTKVTPLDVNDPAASAAKPTPSVDRDRPQPDPVVPARPPAAKPKPPSHPKLSAAELQKEVQPHLGDGEALAHPAFRGSIGPHSEAVVALVKHTDQGVTKFSGFVIAGGKKYPLPAIHDQFNGQDIAAVTFTPSADRDRENELLVVANYITGIGPDGAKPFAAVSVLDWNGKAFVRLSKVEQLLEGESNAVAAKQRLAGGYFPLVVGETTMLIDAGIGAAQIQSRLAQATKAKPTSATAKTVQFEHAASASAKPTTYRFDYDDSHLAKVTLSASNKSENVAANQLRSWLDKHAEKTPSKASAAWKLESVLFELHFGGDGNGMHYRMVITMPKR